MAFGEALAERIRQAQAMPVKRADIVLVAVPETCERSDHP
jgi:hypothetical protein